MEKCDKKEEEIFKLSERYVVFIDETGDPFVHKSIEKYNHPTVFPVLTITALIFSSKVYKEVLVPAVDDIKQKYFGTRDICFHSNEIRRKDGIFKVLLDKDKYESFKTEMVSALEKSSVTIISSSINKISLLQKTEKFKKMSGQNYNIGDIYLRNVDWVLERVAHFIKNDKAKIVFETRGNKESKRIDGVLEEAKKNGTFYHNKEKFKNISDKILFFTKDDNVNGLQMTDYCTYPFARHAKNHKDENILFTLLRKYIHKGDYSEYGLKEWP